MPSPTENILLRIYLQSADRAPHLPTYERLLHAARKDKLAGATVLRGIMGAGYHSIIKESHWSPVQHIPIILEIVDSPEKILRFISGYLDTEMIGGLATLERAAVLTYRHRHHDPPRKLTLASSSEPLSTIPKLQPENPMRFTENGILIRIFIGESDKFHGQPLHESIVQKVRQLGLAGATVLRGSEGFGAHSVLHKAGLLDMSADLPIIIEIVDTEANIQKLLPDLETMVGEGMITMEYVVVLKYREKAV
jgi:uncharacterized protein